MRNLAKELERQLQDNINAHQEILKISKNIGNVVINIQKKLKKKW